MTTKVIRRIVNWNAVRYNQEYDHELTTDLIEEEYIELIKAKDPHNDVDKLDALVDLVFVSIGAIWKLGLNEQQIKKALLIVCDSNDSKSISPLKTASHLKANIDKGKHFVPPEKRLQELLNELGKTE